MTSAVFTTMMVQVVCGALAFTEQRIEVPGRVLWADGVDGNGDKRADLVVVFRKGEEPTTKRAVAWFAQQEDGSFANKPSSLIVLKDDVSFAALADLDRDGRTEVVLVGGDEISSWSFGAEQLVSLVKTQTATPFGENEDLPEASIVGDWHQSGDQELAVWRVGALQFFRRDGATYKALETISIPPNTYVDGPSTAFRGPWSNRRYSMVVSHSFPALSVGHYDADKRPDLFVIDDDRLRVHPGQADGRFSPDAKVFLDFAVRQREEKERKNSFISAQLLDLNGDGMTDYVNNKVAGGLSSMSSETHVHLNRSGFRKQPDQVIKRDGFAAMIQLADLNGDGRPELIEPHANVGLVGLARAMVSKKMSVDWLITENTGGKFNASKTQSVPVVFSLDFSGGPMFKGPFPRFTHDFDGDGLIDFLTSPDGQQIQIYLGQKDDLIETDPAFHLDVEVSPYGTIFLDRSINKPHFVSYFRDYPGKDGTVVVLFNRSTRESK